MTNFRICGLYFIIEKKREELWENGEYCLQLGFLINFQILPNVFVFASIPVKTPAICYIFRSDEYFDVPREKQAFAASLDT